MNFKEYITDHEEFLTNPEDPDLLSENIVKKYRYRRQENGTVKKELVYFETDPKYKLKHFKDGHVERVLIPPSQLNHYSTAQKIAANKGLRKSKNRVKRANKTRERHFNEIGLDTKNPTKVAKREKGLKVKSDEKFIKQEKQKSKKHNHLEKPTLPNINTLKGGPSKIWNK